MGDDELKGDDNDDASYDDEGVVETLCDEDQRDDEGIVEPVSRNDVSK